MRNRVTISGVPLVLAVMLASAAVEAQRRSSQDAPTGERTLSFDGRDRTYLVHDFAGTSVPAPAVIVLHGGGGQAPVPAFIVVGAEDQVVPPQGGPLQLRAVLGNVSAADRNVAPAIDQAAYWARHNGCGEPVRAETSTSARIEWMSCRSGAPVVFHSVKGNGHAWPGGQPGRQGAAEPSRAFDATAEMWAFFKQHRRTVGQR